MKALHACLQGVIDLRDAVMVAQVFEPRIFEEIFEIPIRRRSVLKYSPRKCAVPAPRLREFLQGGQKVRGVSWVDAVFDRDHDGTARYG